MVIIIKRITLNLQMKTQFILLKSTIIFTSGLICLSMHPGGNKSNSLSPDNSIRIDAEIAGKSRDSVGLKLMKGLSDRKSLLKQDAPGGAK